MAYLIQGKKHPLIYCANYRVGSTSTQATLMEMGASKLGQHHHPPGDVPGDAVVAETVRHHCDVIVSWWCWRNSTTPFPKFVNMVLEGKHSALDPYAFYGKFPTNYIMRYESLSIDWPMLCHYVGLDFKRLKPTPTKRPNDLNWRSVFPHHLKEKVCERYKDEMERFGYGCD